MLGLGKRLIGTAERVRLYITKAIVCQLLEDDVEESSSCAGEFSPDGRGGRSNQKKRMISAHDADHPFPLRSVLFRSLESWRVYPRLVQRLEASLRRHGGMRG